MMELPPFGSQRATFGVVLFRLLHAERRTLPTGWLPE